MALGLYGGGSVPSDKGGLMGNLARKDEGKRRPAELCELCGEALEIDPESREGHCIFCEEPEKEE